MHKSVYFSARLGGVGTLLYRWDNAAQKGRSQRRQDLPQSPAPASGPESRGKDRLGFMCALFLADQDPAFACCHPQAHACLGSLLQH